MIHISQIIEYYLFRFRPHQHTLSQLTHQIRSSRFHLDTPKMLLVFRPFQYSVIEEFCVSSCNFLPLLQSSVLCKTNRERTVFEKIEISLNWMTVHQIPTSDLQGTRRHQNMYPGTCAQETPSLTRNNTRKIPVPQSINVTAVLGLTVHYKECSRKVSANKFSSHFSSLGTMSVDSYQNSALFSPVFVSGMQ